MYSLPRPSERYTEQVTPLLVYAQRQLVQRIKELNGPELSRQACARYEAENGEKVSWADSHSATHEREGFRNQISSIFTGASSTQIHRCY
jgi:hypothetical protein